MLQNLNKKRQVFGATMGHLEVPDLTDACFKMSEGTLEGIFVCIVILEKTAKDKKHVGQPNDASSSKTDVGSCSC